MTDLNDELKEIDTDDLLYFWITKNLNQLKVDAYAEIEKILMDEYDFLPESIDYPDEPKKINYDDKFVNELIKHVTKNNIFNNILIHMIEPLVCKINFLSILSSLIFGALFVIYINTSNDVEKAAPFAIALVISIILKKNSYKIITNIYEVISKKITPIDLLKILGKRDHVYEKKYTINTFDNSKLSHIYNTSSDFLSKKETVCRNIIKKYNNNEFNTNADNMTIFFAINYLTGTKPDSLERDNFLETGIEVLHKIYTFQRKSIYVNYYLGIYYFELKKYKEAKYYIEQYLEINKDDLITKVYFNLAKFYLEVQISQS